MLELEELRNRNPRAWTLLLTQYMAGQNLIVEAVGEEPLDSDGRVSRYMLSLADYKEPISFVGKQTNAVEAMFYEFFGPNLPHFTTSCYFHHAGLDDGWLVLADVHNDHAPETWLASDIEILIGNLASLHAAYWGKRDILDQYGLPSLLEKCQPTESQTANPAGEEEPTEQPSSQMDRIERWLHSEQRILTEHALRTAGPSLAPLLARASKGYQTLRDYGGWPGIVDDRHLTALADLLDDPMPLLYPLRQLPCTLLHGNPVPERWCLTLFDDYLLQDWQMATTGPGVYDLVQFIDHVAMIPGKGADGSGSGSSATEETMIDSYILAMRGELGTRFDARSTRLAIPAASCLVVLTEWLPKLGNWLSKMSFSREAWQAMNELPEEALLEAGLADLIIWRQSMSVILDRFLKSFRRL
jgi:hypothetical protein